MRKICEYFPIKNQSGFNSIHHLLIYFPRATTKLSRALICWVTVMTLRLNLRHSQAT